MAVEASDIPVLLLSLSAVCAVGFLFLTIAVMSQAFQLQRLVDAITRKDHQ